MKYIGLLLFLAGIALWLAANALGGEPNPLYMVVDLSGGPDAESWPVSWMETPPGSGWTDEYKSTKLLLRRIDPGSFFMGYTTSDAYGYPYAHVYLSRPFYIGVFEVTQKQYSLVTGHNPSEYQGDTRPVECVSYDNIRGPTLGSGWPTNRAVDDGSFLGLLRTKTKLIFDLPTEAQWEYACRAGTLTELNNGSNLEKYDNDSNMAAMGRYYYNGSKHARVGLYPPNAWGLYDMHGNVQEYCLDWFVGYQGAPYHRAPDVLNLTGPDSGTTRVRRGGSWRCKARDCTSDARGATSPGTGSDDGGFRVAFTTDDSDVYTIRYNRNGGEGHDIYQRVPLGEPATLAPCGFTKAHHVFAGWATMPEGPVRYAAGETVSDLQPDENSIVSLYAVWNLIVRFDANGGTGEMENQLLPYGVPIALNTNAFAREHYAFSGWLCSIEIDEDDDDDDDDDEYSKKVYLDGQIVTAEDILQNSDDAILYAQWTRVEQVVTFDSNGGICNAENGVFTIGGLYSSLPHAIMEHYALEGWYTAPNGGVLVDETTTVTANDNRTLYAHWTRVDQIVTFDPNGGTCDTENRIYTIGQSYAHLPSATLVEHYALAGWYTAPDGGDRIDPADEVPADDTLTLYAHWTLVEQVATFDPNGGSCSETERTYTVGQPYASLPTPTLEHYAVAWYTAPSGGEVVTPDTIVPAIEYQTLYARWTRVDQIVTFDPNGGICDTETQIQTIGQPYVALPFAVLEHCTFAGWFTAPDSGDCIDTTATVSVEDTRTLYAHWKRFLEMEIKALDDCHGGIGTFTISFAGEAGKVYALEHAQSLEKSETWFMVNTLQAEQDGEYTFTTCPPERWHHGFYRVAEVVSDGVQLWEDGPYWAEMNIGAKEPWQYGYYFWWGDTVGFVQENDAWVASDGSGTEAVFFAYNIPTSAYIIEQEPWKLESLGWTRNGMLVPEHDAAQVLWGRGWRMPTDDELNELCYKKCDWRWTTMNGVYGYVVRGRGTFADASIFIPAAGFGLGTTLCDAGSSGYLWSSISGSGNGASDSWRLNFNSDNRVVTFSGRCYGSSIRPVRGCAE